MHSWEAVTNGRNSNHVVLAKKQLLAIVAVGSSVTVTTKIKGFDINLKD